MCVCVCVCVYVWCECSGLSHLHNLPLLDLSLVLVVEEGWQGKVKCIFTYIVKVFSPSLSNSLFACLGEDDQLSTDGLKGGRGKEVLGGMGWGQIVDGLVFLLRSNGSDIA